MAQSTATPTEGWKDAGEAWGARAHVVEGAGCDVEGREGSVLQCLLIEEIVKCRTKWEMVCGDTVATHSTPFSHPNQERHQRTYVPTAEELRRTTP